MPSAENQALEAEQNLGAPPLREQPKTDTLKRKAESLVKLHGITFGTFKGKRCLYCDTSLPPEHYATIKEAMDKGLV